MLEEFERDGVKLDHITAIRGQLTEPGKTLVTEPRDRKKAPQRRTRRVSALYLRRRARRWSMAMSASRPSVLTVWATRKSSSSPRWWRRSTIRTRITRTTARRFSRSTPRARLYRKHVPYHPGSPEAALTRGGPDAASEFVRDTAWSL